MRLILKWVAIPFSRESSQPRDRTQVSCIVGGFFIIWANREVPADNNGISIICTFLPYSFQVRYVYYQYIYQLKFIIFFFCGGGLVAVSNSCDPVDCSLSGSSLHGVLQPRILDWVAISFSRGSFWPRYRTQVSCIAGRFFPHWATMEDPFR